MSSNRAVTFDGSVAGAGPLIVMIPSLGRRGTDFDMLAASLRQHGYSTLPLSGRVVPASEEQTFEDLADSVVQICGRQGAGPAYLLGHAYGQALSRCMVSRHPDAFDGLILLACGASMLDPQMQRSLEAATDDELARTNPSEHLGHVARAFFAPGNDPSVWSDGWSRDLAGAEMDTMLRTPFEKWRSAAHANTLVVQGLQDAVAPPEYGRSFIAQVPSADLVEVDGAGHALLPEQPDAIAAAVISFLDDIAGKGAADAS